METNDPTTTSVYFLNGLMVTPLAAMDASDGFQQTDVHWYEVDVSSGTPVLVQEGLINPAPGGDVFGAAAIDPSGNIGLSYMESSSTEYVSRTRPGISRSPRWARRRWLLRTGGGPMPESSRRAMTAAGV